VIRVLKTPPATRTFWRDYMQKQQPVVMRGVFPDARSTSRAKVLTVLGDVPLKLRRGYSEALVRDRSLSSEVRTVSLGSYLDVERDAFAGWYCTEQWADPRVVRFLGELPQYCARPVRGEIVSQMFVGLQGASAHLHFDGDHAHVLFHQVFGRKKLVIIPPESGRLFDSLNNLALIDVAAMSSSERKRFFNYVRAEEVIVHPGETVYIPPLVWHYLEYRDDAMSVNFRFGRSPHRAFLGDALVSDVHVQALSRWMPESGRLSADHRYVLTRLKTELKAARKAGTDAARVAFRALLAGASTDQPRGSVRQAARPIVAPLSGDRTSRLRRA
jgi:ribosomal protein L16 Arg81 hydroxylase